MTMTHWQWMESMAQPAEEGDGFWSLVGRMSVVFGIPISVPILAGFFWLGSLSTKVDGQDKQIGDVLHVVSGLVQLDAGQTEKLQANSAEIDRLRNRVETMVLEQAHK